MEEKAKVVCNEAGVEIGSGTMLLVAAMCWIGEFIINVFK